MILTGKTGRGVFNFLSYAYGTEKKIIHDNVTTHMGKESGKTT